MKNNNFSIKLSALPSLSAEDQYKFIDFGTGRYQPIGFDTLHEAFSSQASKRPWAIAAVAGNQSISYAELDRESDQLAIELKNLGLSRGDTVGVVFKRSIEMLIAMLATLKCGANYAPQDIGVCPQGQLQYAMQSSGAKLILTCLLDEIHFDKIPTNISQKNVIRAQLKATTAFERVDVTGDDVAMILFTSGTTGLPNGVKVSHRNLCNVLYSSPGNLNIMPGDSVSQILNISFDMAAWEIYACLGQGGTLHLRQASIAETVTKVDVIIATPSILQTLDPSKLPLLKTVVVAGERCSTELANKWSRYCRFLNSCGPTETTIINTLSTFTRGSGQTNIGRPTPNNTVYILDDNRQPVPIGEVGELWAGGEGVTLGYLNNETLTNERYVDDPFCTGQRKMFKTRDLGRWLENGEIEHLGRTDDMVKIKGFRVELDSISNHLSFVAKSDFAATIYHEERVISFVMPTSVSISDIYTKLAKKIPYYAMPEHIIALENIPLTIRGKIDKTALIGIFEKSVAVESQEMVG